MIPIAVQGQGYSGSGAIYDYLSKRPDITTVINGNEFRLLSDPGGFNDYLSRINNYYPSISDIAYKELIQHINIYKIYFNPKDFEAFDKLVKDLISFKYKGASLYETLKMGTIEWLLFRIMNYIYRRTGLSKFDPTNEIVVPKPSIECSTIITEFLSQLMLSNQIDETTHVVLNQAGSYWDPIKSTQLLGPKRKIIRVTRDPRAIFADLKGRRSVFPTRNVDDFINWYEVKGRSSVDAADHTNKVYDIKFEAFVCQFHQEKEKLDRFLGIRPNVASTYLPALSKPNISLFRSKLSATERIKIENKLRAYIDESI